ncbi:CoA transferase [Caulobacter sp.]|uniref:CaiB/BaiF CoA transferase family protein n=1 Tax=Caulobacter sp. TaxID=78 RepID=UPI002B4826ED|nr:CoA transferase [Caulobacter sp.]HJV40703.1 CoA transferase [Caulobacter sp.]
MIKVLKNVRVLEMGTFITGPAAGMLLADLGADVIKVENPEGGDPFRAFEGGLYSPHFQTYNRNKRSITLNTKDAGDLAILDALIADTDVFIQNFRPGVAERLGVGAARLQGLNPRLIYCSISGFGPSGPGRDRPAFDTVAQAASGFLRLLVNPQNPRVVGPAIADAVTGYYAAYGVLGALHERSETGRGRLVEVSMLEAMSHFNLDDFTHYFAAGQVMTPYSRPHVSQSYVFECQDGRWIALHMSSPAKFWENLAQAIDRPGLLEDPRFSDRGARIDNYDAVLATLAPIFRSRPLEVWCERLTALEVPHSPVYASNEVLETPQAKHLQLEVAAEHPVMGPFRTIRSPVSFDGERPLQVTAPPTLGEHDTEVKAGRGKRKAVG